MQINWKRCPYIAILRGINSANVLEHASILYLAGFRAIEIPLNSPTPFASIQQLVENYCKKCLVGAGTVTKIAEVEKLAATGATLMVTPNANAPVIKLAKQLGLYVIAGFMTASEAFLAIEAGADALKLFPANLLSIDYLKALSSVLPGDIPIFAVGGVTPDNIESFISAGFTGAGLGAALYRAGQSAIQTQQRAQQFIKHSK